MGRLITEPKAYLVTKPSVDWERVAAFLADEGVPGVPQSIRAGEDESAAIAEISARLCYMSYGRGRRDIADFINNLLRSKDGSVFEHINYGFVFTAYRAHSRTSWCAIAPASRSASAASGMWMRAGAVSLRRPRLPMLMMSRGLCSSRRLKAPPGATRHWWRRWHPRYRARASISPPITQGNPTGGARGAAQRHRDQDIRNRQCTRMATLHRDARQRIRRCGDTQPGDDGAGGVAARSAAAVRRLHHRRITRRHEDGSAKVLKGLIYLCSLASALSSPRQSL